MVIENHNGELWIDSIRVVLRCIFLSGDLIESSYQNIKKIDAGYYKCIFSSRNGDLDFLIIDEWRITSEGVRLTREIKIFSGEIDHLNGICSEVHLVLGSGEWRFFSPAALYDYSPLEDSNAFTMISEERMAYPLIMAYNTNLNSSLIILRHPPAERSEIFNRKKFERKFLHETEIGSLGYYRPLNKNDSAELIISLPYKEAPSSRMLDSTLAPFSAFLPPNRSIIRCSYLIATSYSESFDTACLDAYSLAKSIHNLQQIVDEKDIRESINCRIEALNRLVHEWDGYVGLHLNFDPRIGIDAPPSGYGTNFNTLDSVVFPNVLEYGFTGRQINNAYMLDKAGKHEVAKRIVNSYIGSCVASSGFLYTLYDTKRHKPINPFKDPVGSRLHYGRADVEDGNYIRNMAEAAFDLCLYYTSNGHKGSLKAAIGFGDFLVRIQNRDGSWYRAYTVEGNPILGPEKWFGYSDKANKSSTSTVIPFLITLYELTSDVRYLQAAVRAGEWLLSEVVEPIDYRGGTLDNPNVVDKEGMAYVMKALIRLFDVVSDNSFQKGALRSGGISLTWNYLWDVPFEPGSRLANFDFKTRGWGGINILWGGGVVDMYSAWFINDWLRLYTSTNNTIFRDVSELVLTGTQQMLSRPGKLFDLIDTGMQEEGFACSNQGIDNNMIAKGSTWGSLGWVFAAGTYPIWQVITRNKGVSRNR